MSHSNIFDPIRSQWVKASPEELVRQRWLCYMTDCLGYPRDLIAVEKSLKEMPHLLGKSSRFPNRRMDVVCFSKEVYSAHEYYPLLLMECKATRIDEKALHQVKGYNHYLHASFIAVANEKEVFTAWKSKEGNAYYRVERLPSYRELIELLSFNK